MINKYDSAIDTKKHIKRVKQLLHKVITRLVQRQRQHDESKLQNPEKEIFDIYTPKLAKLTYGSNEYKECLNDMSAALNHHYEKNSHHPEHYADGINGMNLIDLIEMLCDWKAATERHLDGNLNDSIEINQKRFGYTDELKNIFKNTVVYLDFWMGK